MGKVLSQEDKTTQLPFSKAEILEDYRVAYQSRQASLIGRKEALSGKAKFGIFGDGKEVPQVAMARAFQKGDIRSGYYRDQTLAFALGYSDIRKFFAQLYAHTDLENEPASGGRQMNSHFATRNLNPDGSWKDLTSFHNCSADVSPTGSQMPRMVGLAYASKVYRQSEALKDMLTFSRNGNEICFGTIGNASCAEGMFWETVNAVGVLQAPLLLSIWDDGYGISVPNEYQVTKSNIGELLSGFQREDGSEQGYDIYTVHAWDYVSLCETYKIAADRVREEHVPAIIHVIDVTQPQGHSTSGSHERYKSKERLEWEIEFDCIAKMRQWMLENEIATEAELAAIEKEDKKKVRAEQKAAWKAFMDPIEVSISTVSGIIGEMAAHSAKQEALLNLKTALENLVERIYKNVFRAIHKALLLTRDEESPARNQLIAWRNAEQANKERQFSSHLHSESAEAALKVEEVKPVYADEPAVLSGFEVINQYFDKVLERDPRVIAFGEDLGHIGGVNQGFAGLQEKYGIDRVMDTGIRECTILGQAIGMGMRGLRPVAEIQYLDYLLYALQIMSDDLATIQYRSVGGQKSPVIIRTRGHRLEGIWHSGSPMAGIIHLVRGMHVCVPRNFVQAAGMYNTLLQSDEPGLVVEVLNGYRRKENMPENMGEYTVPLGRAEVLREGSDVTVVTYGPLCRIAEEAIEQLSEVGIEVELIDVQTLLPFDLEHSIVESLKKTNRIVFLDEDVPGGTSSYMMQEVLEKQGGYYWLDSEPRTLTAQPHRPAYGSDGDYWSKPNSENIFQTIYELMNEADPKAFPIFYR